VIGCNPSQILSTCHITITSLAKGGHRIFAIVAPSDDSAFSSAPSSEIVNVQQLAAIGIIQTFLIDKFDYSAITQANADAVETHIKNVKPSLVIMPSWKSPNHARKILARTSLIACRGIGTILMYELDANNGSFSPTITFEASWEPHLILSQQQEQQTANSIEEVSRTTTSTTTSANINQNEIYQTQMFTNKSTSEDKGSKTSSYERLEEKFESHRTLLLEEEELF
jgi:hypothetical protein